MDHDLESKKHVAHEIEDEATFAEKASIADYKANAIEAENAEHNMTVIEAVKAYPMASFWAFVMSCTQRVHRQSIMFIMFITSCHVHHSDMI
ncbi:hypothetical protein WHR41_09371 [Cladosporium halotolerans]|uniref:Uncharacterized protein n=1 Tax=Cladosporium halotolerans TaxID=1052096 RepID=A0AB34KFT3_9PEZI